MAIQPKTTLKELEWIALNFSPILETVNVLALRSKDEMAVESLKSFPATPEGNKVAEACFALWIKTNVPEISDEDIQSHIEDGYFELGEGGIYLIHNC